MLNERPVYFNSGNLAESLSIIGHFHTRLEGGKRVCHAFEDGNGNDGVLPVIIEDGSSFRRGNDDIFSATVCSLEIKDGVIDKIEIEPAIYVVKKDNNDYNALRMMGTTSSVYVRKKTL